MRIAPGGWRAAVVSAVAAVALGVLALGPVGVLAAGLGVLVLAFYRDPERTPAGPGLVAPADGTVHEIRVTDADRVEVVIFLNLWHVHVVRAPYEGTVTDKRRIDGHRRPAFLSGAADNAGVAYTIDDLELTLQAGLLARRVSPYCEAGDEVRTGQRVGHIAFGSRVTTTLPTEIAEDDLAVTDGATVRAGETVLVPERVN